MKMIERFKYLRDHDMETLYEINVHLEIKIPDERKELNNMKMIERFKYLRDHDLETLYEINVHL